VSFRCRCGKVDEDHFARTNGCWYSYFINENKLKAARMRRWSKLYERDR